MSWGVGSGKQWNLLRNFTFHDIINPCNGAEALIFTLEDFYAYHLNLI